MHGRTPAGLTPPSDPSDGCEAVPDPAHSLHWSYFLHQNFSSLYSIHLFFLYYTFLYCIWYVFALYFPCVSVMPGQTNPTNDVYHPFILSRLILVLFSFGFNLYHTVFVMYLPSVSPLKDCICYINALYFPCVRLMPSQTKPTGDVLQLAGLGSSPEQLKN